MKSIQYECAYCGAMEASTVDHIPPKSFFINPPKKSLPTVKACARCHDSRASMDDECFRDFLLKYHRVSDQPQVQPLLKKMFRAAGKPKKRRYAENILRSFTNVEVGTFSGIFIGKMPAYRFHPIRIRRVAIRYLKGLYRYVFGYRIPDDANLKVIINPEAVWANISEIQNIFSNGNTEIIQENIFSYSYVRPSDNPKASFWLLVFYSQFPILGYVCCSKPSEV